jgi:arylsulfatase A-like enzyme
VPLLVDDPASGGGDAVGEAVGLSAVPPTILDAMGASTRGFAGDSLLPAVRDGEPVASGPVTTLAVRGESVTQQPIPRRLADGRPLVSARTDRWTYVYDPERGEHELYDRASDPGEQENVYPDDSAPLADLEAAAQRRLDALGADASETAGEDGPAPDGVERRLAALGYR